MDLPSDENAILELQESGEFLFYTHIKGNSSWLLLRTAFARIEVRFDAFLLIWEDEFFDFLGPMIGMFLVTWSGIQNFYGQNYNCYSFSVMHKCFWMACKQLDKLF